ncbi:hypothetical protein ORI89_09895 [Sphingobacterium sp. UT-1RO-CII-1]|uniref:hypothetical protein n=1 Tax=Sphingobacterium sp. UT-1RO-CII-1 TaxID=2995225 RepID=UPI00227B4C57|nr:hypothetical protein [Sphingobacterium sp. UT-1RO-CII-1]MCY4779962.1 hypothetical protein [Sphingobacterium sp. UT-1RO-CII-1]
MKKFTLLFSLLAAFTLGAKAQKIDATRPQTSENVGMEPIKTGNWMVGGALGNIGYSFEGKSFGIALQPKAGYFVSDGIALGLQTNLGFQSVKDGDDIWNYGISPFVRYYFPEGASSTGRFFSQGDIGIAGANAGSDVSFAFGINLGYAHFVTRSVALETTFGYNYSKANINAGDKSTGLGIGLGFQIYLPGKR